MLVVKAAWKTSTFAMLALEALFHASKRILPIATKQRYHCPTPAKKEHWLSKTAPILRKMRPEIHFLARMLPNRTNASLHAFTLLDFFKP
jgi:hypothetical protein